MNIGVTEISPRAVQRAAEKNFKSGYYCCEALMCTIRDEFKLDVPKEVIGCRSRQIGMCLWRIQRGSACTWNVLRKNRAGRANQSKERKMYGTGSRTA